MPAIVQRLDTDFGLSKIQILKANHNFMPAIVQRLDTDFGLSKIQILKANHNSFVQCM